MMRIVHLAPPWISIPPKHYGGTENVIYTLVEEQVAQGHAVTLLAPGDARTLARQISFFSRSLLESGVPWQSHPKAFYHIYKSVEYVQKHLRDFDILHTHLSSASDLYVFPLTSTLKLPHVTTLHSQFPFDRIKDEWLGDADKYYMEWLSQVPMVAISESARRQEMEKFPLNFIDVVHHGVDFKNCPPPAPAEDFFMWVGRIVPEKGLDLAIQAAKQAKVPLIIAGIVDLSIPRARKYFEEKIEPEIDGQQIRYVGPVNGQERDYFLRRARGLLNPLLWEEPFGMVMLEAMAVGCPVIAFRRGAAAELIVDGETGFLVDTLSEMVQRIPNVNSIDRNALRAYAEAHFSARVMAKNYTRVYREVIRRSLALVHYPLVRYPEPGEQPDAELLV
jgi:glycosyltransferase involved in cell wall biosynthesis